MDSWREKPWVQPTALLFLAAETAYHEKDRDRREKMRRILDMKRRMLDEGHPGLLDDFASNYDLPKLLDDEMHEFQSTALVVDLAFVDPFFPYELKYSEQDFEAALRALAAGLQLKPDVVDRVKETRKDALRVHRNVAWLKVAAIGLSGLVVVGGIGFLAAPILGGTIGAAAGLQGAAATSFGLSLLGGGSLAAGGMGMAGGLWIVAGAGAAAGLIGAGGSAALLELGAAQVKTELVKLQVTYKMAVLDNHAQMGRAQEYIKQLHRRRDEVSATLNEERQLNDRNSKRIKELEAILSAIENSIGWMEEKRETPE
jgi:hypothetical protein